MRIRTFAALLLLSALVLAQDAPDKTPISSPKALWNRYQDVMQEYFQTDESDALVRAGRLFDMTGVAEGDRDGLGSVAATDLWYFLARAKLV